MDNISAYCVNVGSINYKQLSRSEELRLARKKESKYQAVREAARNRLIYSNLRQVVNLAMRFGKKENLEDLVQVGNEALMRAVDRYDIKRKKSSRGSARLNTVVYTYVITEFMHYFKKQNPNGNQILNEAFSLLDPEEIPSSSQTPDNIAMDNEVVSVLYQVINSLEPREIYVIEKRFGLTSKKQTLREIGETLKMTKERVRQIQKAALTKIRIELSRADLD